ncbi:hypothetical protein HanRHA438_Chr14g0633551 [Helianthus annuus]|nr:hypothetical protein HanRHA438_Chr14g0633551 [Helianthus annuus]
MAKSEETNSHSGEHSDNAKIHVTGAELQALIDNAVAKAMDRQFRESSGTRSRTRTETHAKPKIHSEAHSKPPSKKSEPKKAEDDNHSSNHSSVPKQEVKMNHDTHSRSCTYKYFVSCKPRDFTGEKGAVDCMTWIDEMDTVVDISGCADRDVVKYASQSFKGDALAWWKSLLQAAGKAALYSMN